MIWKGCLVLCLALSVSCYGPVISEQKVSRYFSGHHGHLQHIGEHKPEHHETYAWAYPAYQFSYYVNDPHTHDNKGQEEHRDGDKVIGMYWLIQPNGLKRIVKYRSDDKDGFHADVEYEHVGGIKHDTPVHGYLGGIHSLNDGKYDDHHGKYDDHHGKYDDHHDKYEVHHGKYDNHHGKYDDHHGKYDDHHGKYEVHHGKYDNHHGKYDNHHGKYDDHHGKYDEKHDSPAHYPYIGPALQHGSYYGHRLH